MRPVSGYIRTVRVDHVEQLFPKTKCKEIKPQWLWQLISVTLNLITNFFLQIHKFSKFPQYSYLLTSYEDSQAIMTAVSAAFKFEVNEENLYLLKQTFSDCCCY